mmetsp:Transcript_52830/g.146305  ORF Transcript_52830/g.146305 Transcript_52830/m.146305 type:complete len:275 (-) Transcript_52830:23-847(-)
MLAPLMRVALRHRSWAPPIVTRAPGSPVPRLRRRRAPGLARTRAPWQMSPRRLRSRPTSRALWQPRRPAPRGPASPVPRADPRRVRTMRRTAPRRKRWALHFLRRLPPRPAGGSRTSMRRRPQKRPLGSSQRMIKRLTARARRTRPPQSLPRPAASRPRALAIHCCRWTAHPDRATLARPRQVSSRPPPTARGPSGGNTSDGPLCPPGRAHVRCARGVDVKARLRSIRASPRCAEGWASMPVTRPTNRIVVRVVALGGLVPVVGSRRPAWRMEM